jgi:flagellar hook protein FlgE
MGFQQGLSGLNAAAKSLDAIGNNVANASTVGFKQSQVQFADVYANSLAGSGSGQIGIGVSVATVAQQFTQGNITSTSNTLDMAISGNGFFRMDDNGTISYSRNGQFEKDESGYIIDSQGKHLTGYLTDASGAIVATTPSDIQISSADLLPQATTTVAAGLTLDSRLSAPTVTPFDPTNASSFNNSTSTTIYDSLGGSHSASLYFVKTGTNAWDSYLTVDGTLVPATTPATALTAMTFSSSGVMTAPAGAVASASFTPSGGGAAQTVSFDFTGTSQSGTTFGVNTMNPDGYASGHMTSFSTSADGTILGKYSNGKTRVLAQVVLANFSNAQGLQPLGNNNWAETSTSGSPLVGAPGSASLGILKTSAVEDSNVDLTAELVNMITAQRVYQANAQTIKTEDQIMQTIVNLR